jgi:hypothetical protein
MDPNGYTRNPGETGIICTSQPAHLAETPKAGPNFRCSHCGQADLSPLRKEKRFSWWWGLSGGTILSALGFVALALFEQYNDSLTELRNDLKHFNETSGDLVKKEEWRNRMNHIRSSFKELQTANLANVAREGRFDHLEQQLKSWTEEKAEMAREVQRLRERLANVEGRQAAVPIVLPVVPGKKP